MNAESIVKADKLILKYKIVKYIRICYKNDLAKPPIIN